MTHGEATDQQGGSSRGRKAKLSGRNYRKLWKREKKKTCKREGERKERKEIWIKGISCPASQVASQIAALWEEATGGRKHSSEEEGGGEKKSMVPVRFLDLWFLSHGTSSVCFIPVLRTTSPAPPLRCLSSLLCSPLVSSLHRSASLMTELLAGDMKAAFSRLISTLKSWEREKKKPVL